MRVLGPCVLAVLVACTPASPPGPVPPAPSAAAGWPALAQRAESSDTTLEFRAYRETYAATDRYAPYGDRDRKARTLVDSLLGLQATTAAYQAVTKALGQNPTDATLHLMARYAAAQLGDSVGERHHAWMFRGLMESVLRSGHGTTTSPFVVISVDEEYDLARYLGLRSKGMQALGECGGRPCDIVHFRTRDGADTTLVFDITIPYTGLERSFRR